MSVAIEGATLTGSGESLSKAAFGRKYVLLRNPANLHVGEASSDRVFACLRLLLELQNVKIKT